MKMMNATDAQAHPADWLDQVLKDREPVVITRPGCAAVAMLPATELDALLTTIHLLRSRANAERLLTSLVRTRVRPTRPHPDVRLMSDRPRQPEHDWRYSSAKKRGSPVNENSGSYINRRLVSPTAHSSAIQPLTSPPA